MKFLTKMKDGGPESPVDAYVLFESKMFGSIMLLKFNRGGRAVFHSHAFNALTWFLCGDMTETTFGGLEHQYKRSVFPKMTPKEMLHTVKAEKDSWCFTIRGPWQDHWYERRGDKMIKLTHGRIEA